MNHLLSSQARYSMQLLTHSDQRGSCRRSGFTLIELLVVVTIIGILLTVGSFGLRNFSKSSGVTAGVPIAEAVFSEARSLASGNGRKTRVLISADANDEERYLRYMIVVMESEASDGEATSRWVAASRGVYLPDGVYFSQDNSYIDHAASSGQIPELVGSEQDIFSGVGSSERNGNLSGPYFYYQFNGQGRAENIEGTSSGEAVSSFVVGAGVRPPGADNPRVAAGSGSVNFGGFVIWSRGTTSVFRHPDQMNIPTSLESGSEF